MQMCHGRRRCTISADSTTFGNPCRPDSRMYLKTVYTCGNWFTFHTLTFRYAKEIAEWKSTRRTFQLEIVVVRQTFARSLSPWHTYTRNVSVPIITCVILWFTNAFSRSITVPRKVLRESFDSPLELDEQDQNAPAFESEFDEDDHIYKESEAIPPAPKLQGAIPRTNNSHAMTADNAIPFDSVSTPNKTDKIAEGQWREENITRPFSQLMNCWNWYYFFFVPSPPIADHHEELFYICLLFSVALFVLLSSIMIVIGRIVLNKRHQQNSNESSVSETAAGSAAMTKLPTEDTTASATTSTVVTNAVADENTSDDIDNDLTTAITISSISNRNNVRTTSLSPQLDDTIRNFQIGRRVPLKLIRQKKSSFLCVSIYLWSCLLCLLHYRQQHLYNTYTPSSYGNLEPSSISPKANLFNSNHHAPIHDNIVRASILHNHPIQRPQPNLSMCLYSFIYCAHSFGHRSSVILFIQSKMNSKFD